jgi:hypothetical protein
MSKFDSTHPSFGDSDITVKAKRRMTTIIENTFRRQGWKTWIKEEVPFYPLDGQPYHLDLGVLVKNKESFDDYRFFGVEIDGETHKSETQDEKDYEKNHVFGRIVVDIFRINVEQAYGIKALSEADIERQLWKRFMTPEDEKTITESNRELARQLKENALPMCRNSKCKHPAKDHNLAGCNYQQTNKAALFCPCKYPHFVSDM